MWVPRFLLSSSDFNIWVLHHFTICCLWSNELDNLSLSSSLDLDTCFFFTGLSVWNGDKQNRGFKASTHGPIRFLFLSLSPRYSKKNTFKTQNEKLSPQKDLIFPLLNLVSNVRYIRLVKWSFSFPPMAHTTCFRFCCLRHVEIFVLLDMFMWWIIISYTAFCVSKMNWSGNGEERELDFCCEESSQPWVKREEREGIGWFPFLFYYCLCSGIVIWWAFAIIIAENKQIE